MERHAITMPTTSQAATKRKPSGKYAGKDASTRQRERKARLLAAGTKLIGRDGFAAVRIDAVCGEAKLTKRYFYESFSNREELLVEAFRVATSELMQSIMTAAAPYQDDPRQLVHAGIKQTFTFVHDNPDSARLIMFEAMTLRGQMGRGHSESYGEFVGVLVAFTKPFLPNDGPGDEVITVMAKGAIGALIHLSQGWIATDFKQPIAELVTGTERTFGGMGRELGISGWLQKS